MKEKRVCLECESRLSGRADKKFCSSECRSSFNNRRNSTSTNLMRNVNGILKKNRRILKKLNPSGKSKVTLAKLQMEGFNLNYFTNIYTTKAGKQYFFCYDQGYLKLDKEYFAVVERQEYVS